ncbi:MAG: hypothetical protein V1743_05780 [Nanoarchaeota archaeon]
MISTDDIEGMQVYLNKLSGKILELEAESNKILNNIIDRDSNLLAQKEFFSTEMHDLRFELLEVKYDLDRMNVQISKLITEFRKKLKKDTFAKFRESVLEVPFEFFLGEGDVKKIIE